MLAALASIPMPPGRIESGEAMFKGGDLLKMRPSEELRKIRGGADGDDLPGSDDVAHPVYTIDNHLAEASGAPTAVRNDDRAMERAVELLELGRRPSAGAPGSSTPTSSPAACAQRAMIAMAIANNPSRSHRGRAHDGARRDDPGEIVDVLKAAQRETGRGQVLITHDLGLIAELAIGSS